MSQDLVLAGIISHPNVFEPKQINGRGDPKFSASLILDPTTDWNRVNEAIQEALAAKFGQQVPPQWRNPIQDATEDGFPGQGKINAYSDANMPPQVVDQQVNPVMDRGALFGGCKVNMLVRLYAYDSAGNRGVAVGLNGIQIVDNVNVQRLDNRKDARDVFQAVPGAPAQLAPTAYSQPQGQPQGGFQPPPQPQGGFPTGAPQQPQGQPQGGFQPPSQGYPQNAPPQPQGQPQAPAYTGPPGQQPPQGGYPWEQ